MINIPTDQLNNAVDKASEIGLLITPAQLNNAIADKFYHCGTIQHHNSKNGRFIFKHDRAADFITLLLWNHETQQEAKHYINLNHDQPRKQLSPAERQSLQVQIDAKIEADRRKQEHGRKQKSAHYVAWFNQLGMCTSHEYLTRKGIDNTRWFKFRNDTRFNNNLLCFPFVNASGCLQGYQTITPDGTKKRFNGSVGGCFWQFPAVNPCPEVFDTSNSFYLIGEGVATVLSAWQAITNYYDGRVFLPYVLVAFNCGNLDKVIKTTASKKLPYILLVDNDSTKERNAGIETAKQLILDNPDAVIYPVTFTNGNDANDYILTHGDQAFINLLTTQTPITKLLGQ